VIKKQEGEAKGVCPRCHYSNCFHAENHPFRPPANECAICGHREEVLEGPKQMVYEIPPKKPPAKKRQCATDGCTNLISIGSGYIHCKKCRGIIKAQQKVEAAQRVLEKLAAA